VRCFAQLNGHQWFKRNESLMQELRFHAVNYYEPRYLHYDDG